MMRISDISRSETVARFRLEGRLTESSGAELLAVIEPVLVQGAGAVLELAGVSYADEAGIQALRNLRARAVVLTGCSAFLSEMLRVGGAVASDKSDRSDESEAALLERLRRGDDRAFDELVERYGPRLFAAARRLLRSDDEARDAVQDALLSVFRGLAAFNGTARLSTWLHRIAINAALMRIRGRKRRAEQSIDDLLPRFEEDGTWSDTGQGGTLSSHDLLERRETRALVRACIDRLPDTYRTVLLMRDIEDLDTEEVADLLGVTPNAVKIRLHRARQALRSLIERALAQNDGARSADCGAAPRALGSVGV
jgi:RNA polymerase sigma-70 factor (ECF subfamily)